MNIRFSGIGFFFTIFWVSVLLFCSCGFINFAGGLETTNGVRIIVCADSVQGTATPGSRITLCDISYISSNLSQNLIINTVYADFNGHFSINSLQNGRYNLTALDSSFETGAIITNIDINNFNCNQIIDSAKYNRLGSISGKVMIDSIIQPFCLVCIKGVALWDSTDINGRYRLFNVPHGNYRLEAYKYISKDLKMIIYQASMDDIHVNDSEQTADLDLELIN